MKRVLIVMALLCGCDQPRHHIPHEHIVACAECDGKGKVTYSEDNPIVRSGLGKPGTFECPICGGSGELIEYEASAATTESAKGIE